LQYKKVVILDGRASGDEDLAPVFDVLLNVLKADGAQVTIFPLREMKLAHCIGCFNCWLRTPGVCVEADGGRDIAKAVVRSELMVLFTPVTFGGYSAELKKAMDRFVQLALPFFQFDHGEVHHPSRYARRPKLLAVGVQRQPNSSEAHLFKTLVGRNAINFHPNGYAAEVVLATDDSDALQYRFSELLSRCDVLPFGDAVACLMPPPVAAGSGPHPTGTRRALLIVGSPKVHEPSASAALGAFLVDCLKEKGWEAESLTLRARLNRPEGERELLSAVDHAGLILLVFPLYVDALPHLLTKALTLIALHRRVGGDRSLQRVVAIVNSGFPEAYQSALALSICREFAEQSGLSWAGSLALGGGGGIGGQSLTAAKREGMPIRNVIAALERVAASLDDGLPVPVDAVTIISKAPLPSPLWNRVYIWIASWSLKRAGARNGVNKSALLARPYDA